MTVITLRVDKTEPRGRRSVREFYGRKETCYERTGASPGAISC